MSRSSVLLSLVVAGVAFAGCQGRPLPLSAQAGSTVVIPLGRASDDVYGLQTVGFGGTEVSDPQRGGFVFRLDGPGGFELRTRLAVEVQASARSGAAGERQILVVVDIPDDAPPGDHSLYAFVRRNGVAGPEAIAVFPPYQAGITILPHEIEVKLPGGGTAVVTGEPTPTEHYRPLIYDVSGGWFAHSMSSAVPRPGFRVDLRANAPPQPGETRFPTAAIVEVTYPADVIGRLAVVPQAPLRDAYWHEDDGIGHLRVHGAALGDHALAGFWVVFDLDDPGRVLDVRDVSLRLVKATDQFGSGSIAADFALLPTAGAVR